MVRLVAFAFKGNISSTVLKSLNLENKFYISSNYSEIEKFILKLIDMKPKYILGLGMYSRIDKNMLRIETQCSNENKKIPINYFLTPLGKTKLAQGIGNSYCNFVSVKIMQAINKQKLRTKYTFIHIPKSFPIDNAVTEIEAMLKNLN